MILFKEKYTSGLFLTLYLFVGFLPSFDAVDKIGSQFVYLSILNLISVLYIFKQNYNNIFFEQSESLIKGVLIFWTLYGVWGVISGFYAVNTSEVWIETSRVFIYVIALLNIYQLLKQSKLNINSIFFLVGLTLFIETIWVIKTFINLNLQNTLVSRNTELRSFTGNINLTAFTMVLKTPFLIFWLYKYRKISIFFRMVILLIVLSTIYLLGSRGANLTLIVIFTVLIISSLFGAYFFNKKYAMSIILTFLVSIGLNSIQFRNAKGINYLQRTTSLNDQSSRERIEFYKNALESIKENPILGIGIGNWKITSIKYDGPDIDSYRVPYHVHNDFLEITAELGIVGFILFYGIYLFLFIGYWKLFRSKAQKEVKLMSLILILGLITYLADSFLNFPFTRPVMQIPNIILIAISILLFSREKVNIYSANDINLKQLKYPIYCLIFSGIIFSSWVSIKVYKSFVEQRFLLVTVAGDYTDYSLKKVSSISSDIPNITALTTPIDALKAALFLRKDSIEIFPLIENGVKANPYMGYGELLKSAYFIEKDIIDSAFFYSKKAYDLLPKQLNHFNHYLNLIQITGDTLALNQIYKDLDEKKSAAKYQKYLQVAGKIKQNIGLSEREVLSKLSAVNPNNSYNEVFNILGEIGRENIDNGVYYSSLAEKEFALKNYEKAADQFLVASKYNPLEKAYYENAANAFMKINRNEKAIDILEKMIEDLNPQNGKAEYLLGVIYLDEKDRSKGCSYLEIAKNKGFKFPNLILSRFCN